MKLTKFTADQVHGFLEFDINFFEELTFLIGINGSGKTSALKLILGLLSPSFNYLNQIEFSSATLLCYSEKRKKNYKITAKRTDQKINLLVYENRKKIADDSFDTYRIQFFEDDYNSDLADEKLSRLREEFDELDAVQEIRNLTTPIFLGLDRKIYEGKIIDRPRVWYRRRGTGKRYRNSALDAINSSLEDVIELVHSFHRQIGASQPKISEEFKNRIFKQSFDFVEENMVQQISQDANSLDQRRDDLTEAIKGLGLDSLEGDIQMFFKKIAKNLDDLEKHEDQKNQPSLNNPYFKAVRNWFINSPQLRRIDDIIVLSKEYQDKVSSLREPVRRLEAIISKFFKESGKKLMVEPDGELVVQLSNGKRANVFQLSSGEKQIIIMIAHLIFYEDRNQPGVFIIDEPELSLHLGWQEIFVESILAASPNTQFILATHSPAIISSLEREQYCQDLTNLSI